MKVLFITNIPSPYRVDFWNELGKSCDLTVWFESQNESNREWEVNNIGVNFKYKFLKGFTLGLDKHINLSIIQELNNELFDIYIIGCYSSPTQMLAINWLKYKKYPFIINSDGGFIKSDNFIKKRFKRGLISSASAWLSSGSNCSEYLVHYGAKKDSIYEYPFSSVRYNGNDLLPLDEKSIEKIKKENQLNKFTILSVGRFVESKGFDILINAYSEIENKDTSLLIIGGGPLKEQYLNLINQRKLKSVIVKDFIQKDQLIDFYKIADLFVFPTQYDVWGLVLNEAITFGLPIVATDRAGATFDLVKEGWNGYVIQNQSSAELSEKLQLLINNQCLRSKFSQNSQELSKSYTIDTMVQAHEAILQDFYQNFILK